LASIEVNLGRKTPEIDVANDSKYDLNCMERLNIAIETARFIEARISNIFIVCNSCGNNPFSKKSSAFCDIQNPIKKVTNPIKVYNAKNIPYIYFSFSSLLSALYFAVYLIAAFPKPKSKTVRYSTIEFAAHKVHALPDLRF